MAPAPSTTLFTRSFGADRFQMVDDRLRGSTIRLSHLQYASSGVFTVLAVGFWVLQVVEHAKFEEMAENNHQRTLPLRAPRGIVFDRNNRVLVVNRRSYSIFDRPGAHQGSQPDHPPAVGVARSGRGRGARPRGSPPPRAGLPADHHRAGRDAGAGRGDQGAAPRIRVAGHRRRAGARPGAIPRRSRRTCSATSARFSDAQVTDGDGLKSGDIVGQAGIEKVYNAMLMGE